MPSSIPTNWNATTTRFVRSRCALGAALGAGLPTPPALGAGLPTPPPHTYRTDFRCKWINYQPTLGRWEAIQPIFSGRCHDTSPWKLALPPVASGKVDCCAAPIWSPRQRSMHRTTHAFFAMRALDVSPVAAVAIADNHSQYRHAFGNGVHLSYLILQRRDVQIERRVTFDADSRPTRDWSCRFLIQAPAATRMIKTARGLGLQFDPHDMLCGISFKRPFAWDEFGNRVPIRLRLERIRPGCFLLTKTLSWKQASRLRGRIEMDDTITAYPDSGTGATTCDGYVERGLVGESWSTIRSGAGTGHNDTGTNVAGVLITAGISSNTWQTLRRSIYTFDTSSIPDSNTITAATLSVYGSGKADALSVSPGIVGVLSTPALDDDLANSDYGQLGTAAQTAEISYSSYSTTGYNDLVWTAESLNNISKIGITKTGIVESEYDRPNSAPTWSMSQTSSFSMYYADELTTTKDPKLVVDHAAGGDPDLPSADTGRGWWLFAGMG